MRRSCGLSVLALFLLFSAPPLYGGTVLVRPDGTGDFPTIQAAIDWVAQGDTIALTEGVFTGIGNRDLDTRGRLVCIRGRRLDPTQCVLDCQGLGRGFNIHSGEGAYTSIQGLTILNGYSSTGGAAYIHASSPSFYRCIFKQCVANFGGAFYT